MRIEASSLRSDIRMCWRCRINANRAEKKDNVKKRENEISIAKRDCLILWFTRPMH